MPAPIVRTHLIASPGQPGRWTVGLVCIAADGARRLAETARDLPTAQAQAWLDARRARRAAA